MHASSFPRKSGVLVHPSSFPGKEGIGTLGAEAREFLDFCVLSGQSLWQMCPLGPTGYGDSPYQCFSAFAGNPLLIDLQQLQKHGWLSSSDLQSLMQLPQNEVDFGRLIPEKDQTLRKAFANYQSEIHADSTRSRLLRAELERFQLNNRTWLSDFSLFMALKKQFGGQSWNNWPADIRQREFNAMEQWRLDLTDEIHYQNFLQYTFFCQWINLTSYAHQRGIQTIGDMPIFVAYDSADVWSNPQFFLLDETGLPTYVAGVPPDYFSSTGQLWGNPLYNWDAMRQDGFSWWISVLQSKLAMYDYIRIDHFRGFASFWAVPFGEKTAINGSWEPAPGKELFTTVKQKLGPVPIIAEDLGLITPEVTDLIEHCGFPGMKVLQFAFDSGEENDHIPHNYCIHSVAYTGTHDNDTARGWFDHAKPQDQDYALGYLKSRGAKDVHWDFVQACHSSVAVFSIIPLQDLLGLDSTARMNIPGSFGGNWKWRYESKMLRPAIAKQFHSLTQLYARL